MSYCSYNHAALKCAEYIANRIIENANDNNDDPLSYSTDTEVVMEYLKELASTVSALLPKELQVQVYEE